MSSRTEPGACPSGGPNLLALPCSLFDNLDEHKKRRIDALQIEFARDSTLLQSRAYDAILKIISEDSDE
jgi:hypothetical protein